MYNKILVWTAGLLLDNDIIVWTSLLLLEQMDYY